MCKKKIKRVKDDLASGGYRGNIYQRPKVGKSIRYQGKLYRIEDIIISQGDTTLSSDYAEASITFVEGKEPRNEWFNLAEILNDKRASIRRCYDTFSPETNYWRRINNHFSF
ncbi:MAG: hypothetical protein KKF39_03285 [Nanoarchaeota archaeon]|nr:hypothetical protein [Nanoarchaeota archaeon]